MSHYENWHFSRETRRTVQCSCYISVDLPVSFLGYGSTSCWSSVRSALLYCSFMKKINSTQIIGILLFLVVTVIAALLLLTLFSDYPFSLSFSLFILFSLFLALQFAYLKGVRSIAEKESDKLRLMNRKLSVALDEVEEKQKENAGLKILLDKLINKSIERL